MDIVIVEDEHLMTEELERLILNYNSQNKVIAKLSTVASAIDYLQANPNPDLIFSDIQLPDGLSFEIFSEVVCDAPIVFCTAYDEYALDAFKTNGIDYILKPFDDSVIFKTLDKVTRLTGRKEKVQDDLLNLMKVFSEKEKHHQKQSLLIHKADKIIPLNFSEIALVHLDSKITYIYTFKSEKFYTEHSLDALEAILSDDFYRINRQFIVNRESIDHVSKYFSRKLLVVLKLSLQVEKIILSKAKSSHFLKWLQG